VSPSGGRIKEGGNLKLNILLLHLLKEEDTLHVSYDLIYKMSFCLTRLLGLPPSISLWRENERGRKFQIEYLPPAPPLRGGYLADG